MDEIQQQILNEELNRPIKKTNKFVVILAQTINKLSTGVSALSERLTAAQKLYLAAIVILLVSDNLGIVALVTVIALTLEFWPIFDRVWHTLSGKAILLLFYAIIANFAIAGAASVVNEVVGVSTQHFSYTHNFAILLYLPAWVIAMTAIAILLLQVAVPFYLVCLLFLRPFGIKGLRLINHNHFKFTTMLVRLFLASIVLYHLMLIAGFDSELDDDLSIPADMVIIDTAEQPVNKLADAESPSIANTKEDEVRVALPLVKGSAQEDTYSHVRKDYESKVRSLIAHFAYHLEADTRSRCLLTSGTNVVELNDYEILQISPDKSEPYGFKFEVKKCISPAFPAVS